MRRDIRFELERELSERDKSVLATLARLRLATTGQLRALYFADVSEQICYRSLNRLRRLGVVSTLRWHPEPARRSVWRKVYQLDSAGHIYTNIMRRRILKPTDYGTLFITHTLAITAVYVELVRLGAELVFMAEPQCWRGSLKPDAYIRLVAGGYRYYWFLEMDMATEQPNRIKQKLVAYERYWASGQEQRLNKIFPKILFLVPDEARKQQIQTIIDHHPTRARTLFRVALQTDAYQALTGGQSL